MNKIYASKVGVLRNRRVMVLAKFRLLSLRLSSVMLLLLSQLINLINSLQGASHVILQN